MGKCLYLDCTSGISGDMFVAALLDLGADEKELIAGLKSIADDGFDIKISKVEKSGIACTDFDVVLDELHDGHDHDMEYLYGHLNGHANDTEEGEKSHQKTPEYQAHDRWENHRHQHRGLAEIKEIISKTTFHDKTKKLAEKIFEILADAEAKAHGIPKEEVHFHEVGAIDSIVDILAAAYLVEALDVEQVYVPYLSEGQGSVRCRHGILSVPVPAVTNIVSTHSIPMKITEVQGELVTPTGAAIVAAIMTSDKLPEIFKIEKTGYGAGKREYNTAGYLRAMLISNE